MINTLFLQREIEARMQQQRNSQAQRKGSITGYATNPMPGAHRKSSVVSKNLKHDEKIKFQEVLENEMKTKIG